MRILATYRPLIRRVGCTLLCCGLAPAMVDAQEFGRPGVRDTAAVTLSALVAADDNGSTDAAVDVRDPMYRGIQVFSVLSAAVVLAPKTEKFHWQAYASTGVRHYLSLQEFIPSGQSGGVSLTFTLGGRTTVSMSEAVWYSPTYALAPFLAGGQLGVAGGPFGPGGGQFGLAGGPLGVDVSPTAIDYGVARSPNLSTFTSLSLSHALTARSSVTVGYTLNRMAFTNETDPDLTSSNASARFTYRITRDASFHAGYGRRLGQYDFFSDRQEARIEDYDLGVDYNRALSLRPSRQTTVNFAMGSSLYRDILGRHFAVTGSATLARRFGRNNNVGVSYSRSLGFVQGLLTPVFSDTVTASAVGALSQRVRFSSTVGYVFGSVVNNVESATTQGSYGAWTGTGQFTVGLTRRMTLETGYTYYQHVIGDAVQLLVNNVPSHQYRQMLYVGLSVSMPLATERSGTGR